MSRVHLVISVGTQEPRIRTSGGEYLLLKDPDDVRVRRLIEARGVRAKGLYEAAKAVLEQWDEETKLSFPILEQAIRYVLWKEGRIDRLVLIATNATPRPAASAGPERDDTVWVARLAERVLLPKFTNQVKSTCLIELSHAKPQLYGNAKQLLRGSVLLEGIDADSRVYACTSPGLPAVNQAMLYCLLHEHSGQSVLFQVEEPDEAVLKRGEIGKTETAIAEADIFGDFIAKQMRTLVQRFDYTMAMSLLDLVPQKPKSSLGALRELLRTAETQWKIWPGTEALPGRWDRYFVRAYRALRVSEAQFALGEDDDGIVWFGDCATYCQDLMRALQRSDESFMEKNKDNKLKDAAASEATNGTFQGVWTEVENLHQSSAQWRNDVTHRFVGRKKADVEGWLASKGWPSLASRCDVLRDKVDLIAARAGIPDTQPFHAFAEPFAQLNTKIDAEIRRQFDGDRE